MTGLATAGLLLVGLVVARALLPGAAPGLERWGWSVALAPALGFGFGSLLFVGWRALAGGPPGSGPAIFALTAIAVAAGVVWSRSRASSFLEVRKPAERPLWIGLAAAAFVTALFFALRAAAAYWLEIPDGAYDAVATWNLRARLLALAPGPLAAALDATNYPLLLPGAIAFQWSLLGELSPQVPRATGLAFLLGTALVLPVALGRGGRALGLAAAALFLAAPFAVGQGCSQEADVPTGYLLLLAAALLARRLRGEQGPRPEIAGLVLGLLAWTKNEGLLWVALALALFALSSPATLRRDGFRIGLGILPGFGALVLFKVFWAPTRGLSAGGFLGAGSAGHLVDGERWRVVGAALLQRLDPAAGSFPWGLAWLFLLVAAIPLRLARRGRAEIASKFLSRTTIACLSIVPVVYLLTPLPLAWHLDTSLDRLLLQLYPLALLAVASAAGRFTSSALRDS